jgi:hypothetical protein
VTQPGGDAAAVHWYFEARLSRMSGMHRMRQVPCSLRRRVRSGSAGVVLLALVLASLRAAAAGTGARQEGDGPAISTGVPAVPEGALAPAPSWAPTPPVEAPARTPVIERWWFWTAVAAVGITAFAIVATTSLSNPAAPSTELGNRVAF